ncbi:MAG TPA: hypothetical protein VMT63_12605 [Bacteroidales bacterium]|nr:hypothetical protein [Bacteroidales bacterium]
MDNLRILNTFFERVISRNLITSFRKEIKNRNLRINIEDKTRRIQTVTVKDENSRLMLFKCSRHNASHQIKLAQKHVRRIPPRVTFRYFRYAISKITTAKKPDKAVSKIPILLSPIIYPN